MSQPLPSLNALHSFEVAARLGSFTLAAAELHVTIAAVSHQVKVLEEELGTELFIRAGRGVVLTDAGHRLHRYTAEAFGTLTQGVGSSCVATCTSSARLAVQALMTAAATWGQLQSRLR